MKETKICAIAGLLLSCVVFSFEKTEAAYSEPVDQMVTETAQDVREEQPAGVVLQGLNVDCTRWESTLGVVLRDEEVPEGDAGICRSSNITCMDYRAVTNEKSNQWKLLHSPECYTDPETGIRMVGDRYCIALGSGYCTEIGTKVNLIMANGSVVKCILGDRKADVHTDETNRYQKFDGSVAETIVDKDVFTGMQMYPEELKGSIVGVEIVE